MSRQEVTRDWAGGKGCECLVGVDVPSGKMKWILEKEGGDGHITRSVCSMPPDGTLKM